MADSLSAPHFTEPQVVCEVPAFHSASQPLSPWLRLAHRRRQPFGPSKVPLQRLLDFELLLVLEGEPWLWIEPAGGAIRLRKGSLALIPPDLVHTWGDTADTHLAVHFDLCAQPTLAPLENMIVLDRWVSYQPAKFNAQVAWAGFDGMTTPIVQQLQDISPWQRCMEELLTLSAGRTSKHLKLQEQSAVQSHLLWALRSWIELDSAQVPPNDPVRKIRALLRHIDPTQRWPIEALAQQAHMSPTAFRIVFHQVTGQSPRRWLEQRRVDLAARRLLNTNLPIATIAVEVGYPDPYHFSRVFKHVTHKSPAHYRKTLRSKN